MRSASYTSITHKKWMSIRTVTQTADWECERAEESGWEHIQHDCSWFRRCSLLRARNPPGNSSSGTKWCRADIDHSPEPFRVKKNQQNKLRAAASHSACQIESTACNVCASPSCFAGYRAAFIKLSDSCDKLWTGYPLEVRRLTADPPLTLAILSSPLALSSLSALCFITVITVTKDGVFLCAV